ncbi:acylphosphatase [Methylocystis heyeri]|uniref:acylphosphatase n=1 Tax=Methylocystis heyeri TaxID=391905 RepID=A0A6B8KJ96_9HYPH|nr:acylphosphatase [Methylocystis heyeri]QGM46633.1 acylphosphatase [Methylocystis heyeri]
MTTSREITGKRFARIIVRGEVQNVGYRVFVAREAGRLRLPGWVRNRRDGTVETLVAGEAERVSEFLEAAKRGPATARIDSFSIQDADEAALREGCGEEGFVAAPAI